MSTLPYVILDLDNCIADDAWRIPSIRWQHVHPDERYFVYHTLAPFDAADVAWLPVRSEFLILTARPIYFAEATREWLRRNNVHYKHILMRPGGDHRSSAAIKGDMVDSLRHTYDIPLEQIAAAYDDHPAVVSAYRDRGLNAHVRAIHNVDAFREPK